MSNLAPGPSGYRTLTRIMSDSSRLAGWAAECAVRPSPNPPARRGTALTDRSLISIDRYIQTIYRYAPTHYEVDSHVPRQTLRPPRWRRFPLRSHAPRTPGRARARRELWRTPALLWPWRWVWTRRWWRRTHFRSGQPAPDPTGAGRRKAQPRL